MRYFEVWKKLALNALQISFVNRYTNVLFILGKAIRLVMTFVFLFLIKSQVKEFAHYTTDQMLVFFITYQIVDQVAQIFYRSVYGFGHKIRNGEFDFYLMRPIKPLFATLLGQPDINDVVFFIPTLAIMMYILAGLDLVMTPLSIVWYVILLLNALLIATAFHILVAATAIFTTEVDGIIWLYRDLSGLARFPVSMYIEPLKLALFFLVPVGMMVTIPAEVLMNVPPTYSIAITLAIGIGFFTFSMYIWKFALKHYSSASS